MKIVKKSISIALAVLMIFSSVSAFASTLNDGLKRTMVAQFKFFDEDGNETTKVYPGEKITAKLYVATDFVGGAHDFYILYDKTFMTLDLTDYVSTGDGYKLKSWTTDPEDTDSPDPSQDKREGEFLSDPTGTEYPARALLRNGLLESDTFTTQGYGGIYISGYNGKSDYFDIDQWLYKFDFIVNSSVSDALTAKIFIPASARITNDESQFSGSTQIARVDESFLGFDYDIGAEAAEDPSMWAEEFKLETAVSDGTIAKGVAQGDTEDDVRAKTEITYGGTTIYTPYLTLGGEETITWTVTDNDNYSEETTATFGDLLSDHAPDYEPPFGYDFDGWTEEDGKTVDTLGNYRVAAGGNTVTGTTSPKDVTVTFWPPVAVEYGDEVNADGKWNGSGLTSAKQKKEKSADYTYGTAPYLDASWGTITVEDGYYFAGWTVLLDTDDLIFTPDFDQKVYGELTGSSFVFDTLTKENYDNHIVDDGDGNLTLDFVPVILPLPDPDIIEFDPNGGNWSGSTDPITQDATHTIRIDTPEQPQRDNFTFDGWMDEEGTVYHTPAELLPIYLRKFDSSDNVRIQTFTAQWTGAEAKMNILVKLQNAEDDEYTNSTDTYPQMDVRFGDVVEYGDLGIVIPDGFVLSSSTPESITITEYGQYYTVYLDRDTVDITWNYMFTYPNGKSNEVSEDVRYGSVLDQPTPPERTDYVFDGWYKDAGLTEAIDADETAPLANTEYFAKWERQTYELTWSWTDETGASHSETDTVKYQSGATITLKEMPHITGYSFEWNENVPADMKMPMGDLTIKGKYTIVDFTLTWVITGSEYTKTETKNYGDAITEPDDVEIPTGQKLTWETHASTMPEDDLEITGSFSYIPYTITWVIADETFATTENMKYGDPISEPTPPPSTLPGKTFAWNIQNETMPANDLTIYGSYTDNLYTITWKIGDTVLKTDTDVKYGDPIVEPTPDAITGKSFAWESHSDTMGEESITINGSYTDILYTVTWIVGTGDEQKTYTTENLIYNQEFTDYVVPTADYPVGKSFGGWTSHINVMPASDVTITGTWSDNLYTITWVVGTGDEQKTYTTENLKYGDPIVDYVVPTDDYPTGKSFDAWENHDSTMPADDITVNGSWKYNFYTITWTIGDKTYTTENMKYGDEITPYVVPEADYPAGMVFGSWVTAFDTMPASDLEILGEWAYIDYTVTWIQHNIDGTETTTEDEGMHIGDTIYEADYVSVTGYDFAWDEYPEKISTSDVTVNGYYTVHTHDINWEISYTDLSGAPQTISLDTDEDVAYGTELEAIIEAKDYSDVIPEGYKFTGWDELGFDTMPDDDITITATLSLLEYQVTFKAGTSTQMSDGAVVEGESYVVKTAEYYQAVADVEPSDFLYAGHYLLGWADEEEPEDLIDTENTFFDDTDVLTKTYIAVWDVLTYEPSSAPASPAEGYVYEAGVKFVAGSEAQIAAGAEIGGDSSTIVGGQFGQLISTIVPAASTLSYPGYDFQGWAYEAGQTEAEDISTDKIAALEIEGTDQTYYAVWTAKNYSTGIVFDANNGYWGDADNKVLKQSVAQTYAANTSVPDDPHRDGYIFAGWSTNKNASASESMTKAVLENTPMTVVLENYTEYTYYAIWSTDEDTPYTVTIHTPDTSNMNYSVLTGDVIGKTGETGTTVSLADVYSERDGFEVDTLATDADFVISYNGNYDIWLVRKTYTVSYYDEDKTTFIGSEDFFYGQTLTEDTDMRTGAVKAGYDFEEWVDESGTAVPFYNTEVTDDVKVYASYTATTDNLGVKIEIYSQNPDDLTVYEKVDEYDVTGLLTDSEYSYVYKAADVPEGCSATDYSTDPVKVTVSTEEEKVIKVYFERANKNVVLTFDYDGGHDDDSNTELVVDSLVNGQSYTAPVPEKDYSEFDGWDPAYNGIVPDASQTYTAQWNHYTMVTFNAGNGQFVPEVETTVKVYEEDAITAPGASDIIPPTGYTFAGWSTDPDADAEDALAALPVADTDDTVTYYAIFGANTYSITFNAGEGTIGTESSVTLPQVFDEKYNVPADPERTGYRFIGWVLNDSTPVVADAIDSSTLADTVMNTDLEANPETYYACYEIITNKVTYYVDGDIYDTDYVGYGEEIVNIKVDGKTVTWYTNSECTVAATSWTMGTSAVSLYTAREDETITVTFDPKGGKFADDTTANKTITFALGDEITCGADPVKQGYKFIGWDVVTDSLYEALWVANEYTIVYSVAGEEEEVPSIYGEAIDFPAEPDEEGYLFEGWFDSTGKEYKDGDILDFVPGEDFTITAKLTIESFMVYYYVIVDDTPVLVDMVSYDYGETVERDIKNVSGADNYGITADSTVAGPYSDAECTAEDSTTVMGTSLLKFYYTVEPETFTVTFDPNGGKFSDDSTDSVEVEFTEGEEITYEEPTKTGYMFAGWDNVSDVLYKAIWVAKEYEVIFNVESDSETIKTIYGEEIEFPADPDVVGKTFEGWFTDDDTEYENGDVLTFDSEPAGTVALVLNAKLTTNKYLITFVDEDGTTILKESEVEYGNMPTPPTTIPTKEADVQYTYTFAGWTPEIVAVTGEKTYTATYSSVVNEYTITFVNDDGTTILKQDDVAYGDMPVAPAETPTKEADAQYTYTFAGWDSELEEVTGEKTYTATYDSTVNKYAITFVDEDGTTVLGEDEVAYGDTPEAPADPTKTATAQYTYEFAGWDPEIVAVTGEKTYTATYTSTVNKYMVKFVDEDGETILKEGEVDYGDTPEAPDDPAKDATAQYTYEFAGWTPEISAVTGIQTYTATYTSTVNEYTIKFVDEDGETVLKENQVPYGSMPSAPTTDPSKAATAQYTYTFAGWDSELEEVTGNKTYKATYISTVNQYTIKFVDEDGTTVLKEYEVAYGEMPAAPANPTKEADEQYTYVFNGWTPTIVPVTGEATYTATYKEDNNMYTITFVDYNGNILKQYEVAYGEMPEAPEDPSREATAQYTYVFAGWDSEIEAVTGTKTYMATYTNTVNKYLIKFVDEDGTTVLKEYEVAYGDMPVAPTDTPTKEADAQYTYTFAGWDSDIVIVAGAKTYKATYSSTVNNYVITWVVDGNETTEDYAYGATPSFKGSTDKAADAQYTYTFTGWSPAIADVTGAATYTAQYDREVNTYIITWVVDGNETTEEYAYGATPSFKGSTDKAADAQYTYTFTGWNPAIADVTGAATYTAQYSTSQNTCEVTFMGYADLPHSATDPEGVYVAVDTKTVTIGSDLELIDGPSIDNYVFEGWYDGTSTDANKVESGTVEGAMTLYARYSRVAVKLVSASESSTAMIERDGIVETYNDVETLPAGVTAIKAPVTSEYGTYSNDYEGFFIYGMVTNVNPSQIEDFVKVTGDGHYELVLTSFDKLATGAVIKVYDDVTDELVEQFYFVVFGDLNGDGLVTSTDTALYNKETKNKDWSEGTSTVRYLVKAADLSGDGRFSSTDTSVVKACIKASVIPDQVTGQTGLNS